MMELRMGQFSGGGFFSAGPGVQAMAPPAPMAVGGGFLPGGGAATMPPFPMFGSFGGFLLQQVPVVDGPVAYYPSTEEQKESSGMNMPFWPFYGPGYGGAKRRF
jgi:hypothetical protein